MLIPQAAARASSLWCHLAVVLLQLRCEQQMRLWMKGHEWPAIDSLDYCSAQEIRGLFRAMGSVKKKKKNFF